MNSAQRSKTSYSRTARYPLLDTIRGLTLISMILYHACWDAVYLLRMPWGWYESRAAFFWQQSICWTFILLSGFCIPFSRRLFRRGLQVFGAGALVTAVTLLVLPEDRVVFGVLTLLGSCMLGIAAWRTFTGSRKFNGAEQIAGTIKPAAGAAGKSEHIETAGTAGYAAALIICAFLFALTYPVNGGFLGLGTGIRLPVSWYRNLLTTFLGFPMPGFFSTDYFSLFPWMFLYLCGVFFCKICIRRGWLGSRIFQLEIRPLSFLGRHSLLIYLLHQPVLYAVVLLLQSFPI